jgi:flagellar hook-associated protein 1 FlgK
MVDQMGLDLSLRTAMSGLRTVQKGLDTVSSNIANADTPGYTRKVLTQSTVVTSQGQSVGVQTGNIEREVDTALQRETLTQESRVSNLEVLDQYLGQIEMLHGDPEQETSLGNVVNQMRDGFAKLMDTPNSIPLQNDVISLADNLARTLNRLSEGVNTVRTNVQGEIEGSINDINTQFQTIADLNRKISTSTALGQTEPDLEDKRDEAVRLVAEQIDINVMKRSNGTISILDQYGQPLLEDDYKPLSNDTTVISPQVAYPGGIPPIRLGDPLTGTDVTGQLRGGKLGALIELRDQTLPRFQSQLDEFSQTLSETFSTAGLTLFTDINGVVPADTPTTASIGYANQIQVSQTVRDDPTLLRDGDTPVLGTGAANSALLRTIVDSVLGSKQTFQTSGLGPNSTLSTILPASTDFASFATELVSYQVNQRANATSQLESATSLRDQLKTRLSDQSGVNLDTEVSLLIQLQRSYSSSAQVVSTNRQMFNDLISIVR